MSHRLKLGFLLSTFGIQNVPPTFPTAFLFFTQVKVPRVASDVQSLEIQRFHSLALRASIQLEKARSLPCARNQLIIEPRFPLHGNTLHVLIFRGLKQSRFKN
jgi:hypothetical protein